MTKARRIGVVALIAYGSSIVLANWLISHVGTVVLPGGTHLIPVGFGLMAPSGTPAAAVALVARDVVQRSFGRWATVWAILAGAALSAVISPALALASGVAFLFGEFADFAVYTPLEERNLGAAVIASGIVGGTIDSMLFLTLARIPLGPALPGLLVAKAYIQVAGWPVVAWARTRTRVAA